MGSSSGGGEGEAGAGPGPGPDEDEGWKEGFELIDRSVASDEVRERGLLKKNGEQLGRCQCPERALEGAVAICNDDSCLNYAMRVECSTGHCGPRCRNQRLQRREAVQVEVFRAGKKGWGLRLTHGVSVRKGQLLGEYVGEIITQTEMEERMSAAGMGLNKLYMMALGKGLYLDARHRGGRLRFINHSCEPNCIMEHWAVKGVTRCAVIALRDLNESEELSFDYQWETRPGRVRTRCLCGTKSCRGFLEVDEESTDLTVDCFRVPTEEERTGEDLLVGKRVSVYWNSYHSYFAGRVISYNSTTGLHCIAYEKDGEEHHENLGQSNEGSTNILWKIWDESLEPSLKKKVRAPAPPLPDPIAETTATPAASAAAAAREGEKSSVQQPQQLQPQLPKFVARKYSTGGDTQEQKFVVPTEHVKSMVVNRGQVIHAVEDRSGARVSVSREGDARASHIGQGQQLMTIRGSTAQISVAIGSLRDSGINFISEGEYLKAGGIGVAVGSASSSSSAPMTGTPSSKTVDEHKFVVTCEHARAMLVNRGQVIHTVESGSGARVTVFKDQDPRAPHVTRGSQLVIIKGSSTQISEAVRTLLLEAQINLQPESEYLISIGNGSGSSASSLARSNGHDANGDSTFGLQQQSQQQRPRKRKSWCLGWDWTCLSRFTFSDSWKDADQHCKIALETLWAVADSTRLHKEATLHAAMLVQRHLLLSSPAEIKNVSPFILAIACLRLATRTLRVRVAKARPPSMKALLEEAYRRQFPGRDLSMKTADSELWEKKVGQCEAEVVKSHHFDVTMEDPLAVLKSLGEEIKASAATCDRACDIALSTALSGSGIWLLHCRPIIVAAVLLIAHMEESGAGLHTCKSAQPNTEENVCASLKRSAGPQAIWEESLYCALSICREVPSVDSGLEDVICATFPCKDLGSLRHKDPMFALLPKAMEAAASTRLLSSVDFVSEPVPLRLGNNSFKSAPAPPLHLSSIGALAANEMMSDLPPLGRDSGGNSENPSSKSSGSHDRVFRAYALQERLEEAGVPPAVIEKFPLLENERVVSGMISLSLPPGSENMRVRVISLKRCSGAREDPGRVSTTTLCELSTLQRLHMRSKSPEGNPYIVLPLAGVGDSAFNTSELRRCPYMLLEPVEYALSDLLRVWKSPHPPLPGTLVQAFLADLVHAVKHCHDHGVVVCVLETSMIYITSEGSLKLGGLGCASLEGDLYRPWEDISKEIKRQEAHGSEGGPGSGSGSTKRRKREEKGNGRSSSSISSANLPSVKNLVTAAPELLLSSQAYTPASDSWAIACLGAQMCLSKPLFRGKDSKDQMRLIVKACGSPSADLFPSAFRFQCFPLLRPKAPSPEGNNAEDSKEQYLRCKPRLKKVLSDGMGDRTRAVVDPMLSLLCAMLHLDPGERVLPRALLRSKEYASVMDLAFNRRMNHPDGRALERNRRDAWQGVKRMLDSVEGVDSSSIDEAWRRFNLR